MCAKILFQFLQNFAALPYLFSVSDSTPGTAISPMVLCIKKPHCAAAMRSSLCYELIARHPPMSILPWTQMESVLRSFGIPAAAGHIPDNILPKRHASGKDTPACHPAHRFHCIPWQYRDGTDDDSDRWYRQRHTGPLPSGLRPVSMHPQSSGLA